METKREHFERIANARKDKILKMVSLLGNLTNKSFYEYDKTLVRALFNEIEIKTAYAKEKLLKGAKNGK